MHIPAKKRPEYLADSNKNINFAKCMLHLILYIGARQGPVAQLNRAADSGSEDRGFESHRDHFITTIINRNLKIWT